MGSTSKGTRDDQELPSAARHRPGQPQPPGRVHLDAGPLSNSTPDVGAEDPTGVLGAVVRAAGSPEPVRIRERGFLLAADPESARTVLTSDTDFAMPFDASRRAVASTDEAGTGILAPQAVAVGRRVFAVELDLALEDAGTAPRELDTLHLLRRPVSVSTTAALLPDLDPDRRDQVADRVVDWVDALGPVISALDPPRRWSSIRRRERRARTALHDVLVAVDAPEPASTASALAAGVQVPIAAGAFCLVVLAGDPALQESLRADPELVLPFVWEILRLYPPTWLLPRITTTDVVLGTTRLPAHEPVVVSPVALGRLPRLVPGSDLHHVDPHRWRDAAARPGAWLPFGAGPHACPGRHLGLAQLTELTRRCAGLDLSTDLPLAVDASRGLSPSTSRITVRARPERHYADGDG